MKIRLVGAELFHANGRTGMTKLVVDFRYLCESGQKLQTQTARQKRSNVWMFNIFALYILRRVFW